jgi:hypothetical protein
MVRELVRFSGFFLTLGAARIVLIVTCGKHHGPDNPAGVFSLQCVKLARTKCGSSVRIGTVPSGTDAMNAARRSRCTRGRFERTSPLSVISPKECALGVAQLLVLKEKWAIQLFTGVPPPPLDFEQLVALAGRKAWWDNEVRRVHSLFTLVFG